MSGNGQIAGTMIPKDIRSRAAVPGSLTIAIAAVLTETEQSLMTGTSIQVSVVPGLLKQ